MTHYELMSFITLHVNSSRFVTKFAQQRFTRRLKNQSIIIYRTTQSVWQRFTRRLKNQSIIIYRTTQRGEQKTRK